MRLLGLQLQLRLDVGVDGLLDRLLELLNLKSQGKDVNIELKFFLNSRY